MKSAGVITGKGRGHHALVESFGAMLIVLFASALAAAQSIARSADAAPIAKAPPPSVSLASTGTSADSANTISTSDLIATAPDPNAARPGTLEIAPANSVDAPPAQPPSSAIESQPSGESGDVERYREDLGEQLESEGELSTPLGMQLREAQRRLKSGEEAKGLLITAVVENSPAAAIGLRAYRHGVHDLLTGGAKVGALLLFLMVPGGQFAILLEPAIDSSQVAESYDMIIGVDGFRVISFLDFQDQMRDLQPGELIYLSVVRDGERVQLTMPVPANILQATN
ncbi:MAG: PDZ domain-containing protein [Candidatus Binatus sp.]